MNLNESAGSAAAPVNVDDYDPMADPKRRARSNDPGWKYGYWTEIGIIFANFIWDYISYILLFLHISKASPRLTPYRLKGKKGVGRLRMPYRLKNYG
jgi:hypothetical protein